MGGCIMKSKAHFERTEKVKVLERSWMRDSGCLDKFSFDQSVSIIEYNELQNKLAFKCLRMNLAVDEFSTPEYNREFLSKAVKQMTM